MIRSSVGKDLFITFPEQLRQKGGNKVESRNFLNIFLFDAKKIISKIVYFYILTMAVMLRSIRGS